MTITPALIDRLDPKKHASWIAVLNAELTKPDRDTSKTPLMLAAELGDERMVNFFLAKPRLGGDVNAQNGQGKTAAHLAAGNGHTKVLSALELKGALLNLKDKYGNLPAHDAARAGHADVMDLLNLVKSSTLQATNASGESPAHLAAANGRDEVINRLAMHKGLTALTRDDRFGDSPLHLATVSGHAGAVQALLDAGVPPNQQDAKPQYLRLLDAAGASRVAGTAATQQGHVAS